jgi:hypothetical protein
MSCPGYGCEMDQLLLSLEDSFVRITFVDDRLPQGAVVKIISAPGVESGILPVAAHETPAGEDAPPPPPAHPTPKPFPEFPWFPTSLIGSREAEGVTVELRIDLSELPAGVIPFVLDPFIEGVRAAVAARPEQPVRLTSDEAERWGAQMYERLRA